MIQTTICTGLGSDCLNCKRRVLRRKESRAHPMQWPSEIIQEIWLKVRDTGMWRARMKKRLWSRVHDH
eukprot:3933522-Prymnesium_polylepis.1